MVESITVLQLTGLQNPVSAPSLKAVATKANLAIQWILFDLHKVEHDMLNLSVKDVGLHYGSWKEKLAPKSIMIMVLFKWNYGKVIRLSFPLINLMILLVSFVYDIETSLIFKDVNIKYTIKLSYGTSQR